MPLLHRYLCAPCFLLLCCAGESLPATRAGEPQTEWAAYEALPSEVAWFAARPECPEASGAAPRLFSLLVCFACQVNKANNKKLQATTAGWPREKRGCASVFAIHLPGIHIHLLKKKGEQKESPQVGHSFVSRSNWTFNRSGLAYLISYVCNCNACYVARAKCSELASHSARPYSFWFVYIPHNARGRCACVCVCVCVRASAMHAGVAAKMVPVRCTYPLPLDGPNRGR